MAKIMAAALTMIMCIALRPVRKGGERFLPGEFLELDEKDFLRKERTGVVKRAPEQAPPVNQKAADAVDDIADTAVGLLAALDTGDGTKTSTQDANVDPAKASTDVAGGEKADKKTTSKKSAVKKPAAKSAPKKAALKTSAPGADDNEGGDNE